MIEHKKYNFTEDDVSEVYSGPGGKLWELLMGEQIHVGGIPSTNYLVEKVGRENLNEDLLLLDICCALGGPARQLAEEYGINVIGLDMTEAMVREAIKRTKDKPYRNKIEYRLGSALNMPLKDNLVDIAWGQDAWCYITDKNKLFSEIIRVLKPGGYLAFTDWIWGSIAVSEKESDQLMEFMVFPNMETLDGYCNLIEKKGFDLITVENLGSDFKNHMGKYEKILKFHKKDIIKNFGEDLYIQAENGILTWKKALNEHKVTRGLWVAKRS